MLFFKNKFQIVEIVSCLISVIVDGCFGLFKRAIRVFTIFKEGIETGEREADYATLIMIADYFDVSIDYLLERTDKPEINK